MIHETSAGESGFQCNCRAQLQPSAKSEDVALELHVSDEIEQLYCVLSPRGRLQALDETDITKLPADYFLC